MEKAKILTERYRCKDHTRIHFSAAKPVAKPDFDKGSRYLVKSIAGGSCFSK